ncbi:unnamed protein product [Prunus brigantina]
MHTLSKCQFMVKRGVVLGHVISSKGIEVDKAKIDIISNMAAPASVKGVRSFLGHADCVNAFNILKRELTSCSYHYGTRLVFAF